MYAIAPKKPVMKKLKITIKKPSFKIFDNVLLAGITVDSFSNVAHEAFFYA